MSKPSIDDVLRVMQFNGAIDSEDADKYLRNYDYLQQHRTDLEENHAREWIASLNGKFYFATKRGDLERKIKRLPGEDRAYIERLGTDGYL